MNNFAAGPFVPILVMGLMAFLVEREPDLGTCLVVLGAGFGALFFAGMRISHLVATLCVAGVLIGGMLALKSHSHSADAASTGTTAAASTGGSYRGGRIFAWLHPDDSHTAEGYQVYHGMIALGTGGPVGLGVGEGRQKYYLPEAHTDFIFATLAEEGGLVASLFVLALFAVLIGRGMHIASMTKDPFGAIVAGGISAGLATQALLNIAVVTSSVPATGVPLPFLSYGGTSLFVSMLSVGILLSIHRNSEWDDDGRTEIAEHAPDRDFDRRWNKGATLSRPEYARGGAYRGSEGYRESGRKPRPHAPIGR
jgi:cell division protein FtsW